MQQSWLVNFVDEDRFLERDTETNSLW